MIARATNGICERFHKTVLNESTASPPVLGNTAKGEEFLRRRKGRCRSRPPTVRSSSR